MRITHEYYESIDSTNNELKRRCEAGGCPEGTVISAGQQTAGRGRSGHQWISPPKVSVATSMVMYPTRIPIADVPRITLIAAISVARAIEDTTGLPTRIKWPNDIIIDGRKVCGILTEMSAASNHVRYVIVGIGVNVHNRSYNPDIADMAISLDEALEARGEARHASRRQTDEAIWEHFAKYYEQFLTTGDLRFILDDYNERLANRGKRVRVLDPAGAYEAEALGIGETGALIIDRDGERRSVDSGEVHVRGLYGYI